MLFNVSKFLLNRFPKFKDYINMMVKIYNNIIFKNYFGLEVNNSSIVASDVLLLVILLVDSPLGALPSSNIQKYIK